MTTEGSIIAVSGNPRVGSRTLLVARTVAEAVASALSVPTQVTSLELAEVAGELFAAEAPAVDAARAAVSGARVVVVATPVYKASYTGLLKAFADRFGPGGLAGVLAVPVVVSASPAHSFVAEHLLRPLLVELGAEAPTRPFAVTEGQLGDLDRLVRAWAEEAVPTLTALTTSRTPVSA